MTKYVLQSGGLKNEPDAARSYFAELFDGLSQTPKLLWCFFATLPDDCDERFREYTEIFRPLLPVGVDPVHSNASIEQFEDQVRDADAIYMHGGSTAPLKEVLKKYDLQTLFADKAVGTNSASSMALSAYAWDCDHRKPEAQLGFFPIKFFGHFKSTYGANDPRGPIDWDGAYKQLERFGDVELPIYALKEGEFIVMEK